MCFALVYPHIHYVCLIFGSNSFLAGVLHFYTHISILLACFMGLTPFLQVFLHLYTHMYILFACFLGLTPFLQVFSASIPVYTFSFVDIWVSLPCFMFFTFVYPRIHSICLLFG